ncbi:MAG: glycoside hydrolase family 13 protein [Clostridia bacterium]|nr:glycoside hydrolase family 13 protein [Clostridia bacterium]
MWWDCMQNDNEEWWKFQIPLGEKGLYFYHFEYDTSFGTSNIFRYRDTLNGCFAPSGEEWQITVYSKDFSTPDWIKGGVIYQIFPDRFYFSGQAKADVPKNRIIRTDYDGEPYWRPDQNGKVLNNDFFGGDLKGIEEKLDYISSLGVSCIYLNPIFEAQSNHRYDTADYEKIDPLLGNENDFVSLCKKAEEHGIKIILDGVFSHTGSDSRYFNKNGRYPDTGAFQSKDSPYYKWYKFLSWPHKYESWWGIDILPEVIEETPDFINYISGEGGILQKWLSAGASGWRLDVADELPDEFLDALRKSVKSHNPDALIIGEVWEDASNKSSYGKRRRYLQGDQLDSVMNYPFADCIIDFVRYGNAENFEKAVVTVIENYPKPVIDTLMNHIGTHDTQRAITALAGESCIYRGREWQSGRKLDEEKLRTGIRLLKQAAVLQFTLPGVPSVYYGDEAGLEGYKDPFNRGYYPWGKENNDLLEFYRALGKVRKENPQFASAECKIISAVMGCVAYSRDDITVISNSNNHPIRYFLPEDRHGSYVIFGESECDGISVSICANSSVILKR